MRNHCGTLAVLLIGIWSSGELAKAQQTRGTDRKTIAGPSRGPSRPDEPVKSPPATGVREEDERYTGIAVRANPGLGKQHLDLQREIAGALMRVDFVPRARRDRFAWLEQRFGARITGWSAEISSLTQTPTGVVVQVQVRPKYIRNPGLMTTDFSLETYRYRDKEAQFLSIEFNPAVIITFN